MHFHPPALTADPAGNVAAVSALLESGRSGVIVLPPGRIPWAGCLEVPTGWTIRGAGPGATTLVQQVAAAQPMLQVTGSGAGLHDLQLELPAASPGPHDGANWTAVTIGRYFYAGAAQWTTDVTLSGLTVTREGRCAANTVTVIGAVRDMTIRDLAISGGGTGVMVHWGGVGTGVQTISGPSYHPHRLTVDGLTVRAAFEGFCLSSVHDVRVRRVRCEQVEIGFRLLTGDNADRFHYLGADSEINQRISVEDCDIGWSGDMYAVRIAGWGRSELDGVVSLRGFDDLALSRCRIRPQPIDLAGGRTPRTGRRPVVLEGSGPVDLTEIAVV